jgi:hypothetical protein
VSELAIRVVDVRPEPYAATPNLLFGLDIEEKSGTPVHSLALRTQVRIEPQRRQYSPRERDLLRELFGIDARWGETLLTFSWSHISTVVPGFEGRTRFDLRMPVTYDFEVAAAKYLHSLDDGSVPLRLLVSGTAFEQGEAGVQVGFVPWNLEATCQLPVSVWRRAMDDHFPGGGWLRLSRRNLDALLSFKARRALSSWDETIEELIRCAKHE